MSTSRFNKKERSASRCSPVPGDTVAFRISRWRFRISRCGVPACCNNGGRATGTAALEAPLRQPGGLHPQTQAAGRGGARRPRPPAPVGARGAACWRTASPGRWRCSTSRTPGATRCGGSGAGCRPGAFCGCWTTRAGGKVVDTRLLGSSCTLSARASRARAGMRAGEPARCHASSGGRDALCKHECPGPSGSWTPHPSRLPLVMLRMIAP